MTPEPTAEQRGATSPDRHVWASACAGAGKTSILIDRVARLLLTGVKPQSLVCLTYTRAAANEIAERLFDRLGTWCILDDEALIAALTALGADPTQDTARARGLFADALETPGGLRIQTIHSFCAALLRRFPLEAGVPAGFVEIDDIQQDQLRRRALNEVIATAASDSRLDATVRRVITAAGGRALFDTVADVMTHRASFARRLADSDQEQNVLDELQTLVNPPSETVENLCHRVMETELPRSALTPLISPLRRLGRASNILLADTIEAALDSRVAATERYQHYRRIVFGSTGEMKRSNPYTRKADSISRLAAQFSMEVPYGSEINRILAADDAMGARICFEQSQALLVLCARVVARYRDQKKQRGWLDYDDLIHSGLALFGRSGAADWVAWKLDGNMTHLLIDEAQDTSPEQWHLLDALTEEFFAGHGRDASWQRTMFVVGDQRQSIYSFHGAVPADFPRQRQNFILRCLNAGSSPEILMLNTSFRSAPEILRFVDAVSDIMPDQAIHRRDSSLPPPENEPAIGHHSNRRNAQGRVELWLPEKKKDQSTTVSAKVSLARDIAAWADEALARAVPVGDSDQQRPLEPGDIMVLVRGRADGLFDALHGAFRRLGLPVVGADRLKLTDSPAVQDCLNLIRFALCPQDDLVLAELLTSPFCGLNRHDHLFELAYNRGQQNLWDRLRDTCNPDLTPARDFLTRVLALGQLRPFEFLSSILDHPMPGDCRTGRDALFHRFGAPEHTPVNALVDSALAADRSSAASLQRFIHDLEQINADIKTDMTGAGQIRIMTVHAAKGTESPMVILPDCTAPPRPSHSGVVYSDNDHPVWTKNLHHRCQNISTLRNADTADRLEDSQRLLYVALTRARDHLLITGPPQRNSTSGYAKTSWMALCHHAMTSLYHQGQARKEHDSRFVLGPKPHLLTAAQHTGSTPTPAPPQWLTTPVPSTPSDLQLHTTASSTTTNHSALRRGVLIHDLLERLHRVEPHSRSSAAQNALDRKTLTPDQKNDIIQTTLAVLSDPSCAQLFSESARSEVPIAGDVTTRSGQTIRVNGRIDRLIVTGHQALVVEIKSDRRIPDTPGDVSPDYLRQLALYALLIGQAYPNHTISAALLWTAGPQVMPIDADLIETHRPA